MLNSARSLLRHASKAGLRGCMLPASLMAAPAGRLGRKFANAKKNQNPQYDEIVIDPEAVQATDTTTHEFQAETRKLLQIVAKSIYTDSEVFVRELLSNASDALEKEKYRQLQSNVSDGGDPLQIAVTTNEAKRQISILDTGIGMTKEELIENLGTIAKSGSKAFLENLKESGKSGADIIGQFGVGFYSSFIVGNTVEVISKKAGKDAYVWVSDGSGQFTVSKAENVNFDRGTKVIIHLTPENQQFARKIDVEGIIKKYSNFVNYPIFLNGEKINISSPIWIRDKNSVTEAEYKQLWELTAKTKLNYQYKLHYSADVPIQVKAVLFIPQTHSEKMGLSREESQISLYSRKVLIKDKCQELLPSYLRFVKGVVDCEDLPLNISRENYQDSHLIARLRSLLTKRILKALADEMNKNPAGFDIWAKEFAAFIGEGIISDKENSEMLVKLMRFKSSYSETTTIDDYLEKMKPGQSNIYFTIAENLDVAKKSPFMDPFVKSKTPVLLLNSKIDEFFLLQMERYKGHKFVSIESSYDEISKDVGDTTTQSQQGLNPDEVASFCLWVKVQVSKRLNNVPAIIVSPFPSSMKTYIQLMEPSQLEAFKVNHTMEINPNHSLIVGLNNLRKVDLAKANLVVRQLLDNTLLACGLLIDPTDFVNRVNLLMENTVTTSLKAQKEETGAAAHREVIGSEKSEADTSAKDSALKEAYAKMRENLSSKMDKPVDVEIGADGKPLIK